MFSYLKRLQTMYLSGLVKASITHIVFFIRLQYTDKPSPLGWKQPWKTVTSFWAVEALIVEPLFLAIVKLCNLLCCVYYDIVHMCHNSRGDSSRGARTDHDLWKHTVTQLDGASFSLYQTLWRPTTVSQTNTKLRSTISDNLTLLYNRLCSPINELAP